MLSKTKLALGFALVVTSGSAALACDGYGVQASDCLLYYGPSAQSPYKGFGAPPSAAAAQATENAGAAQETETSPRVTHRRAARKSE